MRVGYDPDRQKTRGDQAMSDIKFGDWRLTCFWVGVAAATAIAGFVFGWCWRDRSGALADVSLLSAMTAFGTLAAVCVALWVADRQRLDVAAMDARAGRVAYWIVRPEVLKLREQFRDLDISLDGIRRLDDGLPIPLHERRLISQVTSRMSMDGTKEVLDKLPLLSLGAGEKVAEVYGSFERLKSHLAQIASHEKGMDMIFRAYVDAVHETIKRLEIALKSPNIWG